MSKSRPVEGRVADSPDREDKIDLEVRLPTSRNILRHSKPKVP